MATKPNYIRRNFSVNDADIAALKAIGKTKGLTLSAMLRLVVANFVRNRPELSV